MGGQTVPFSAAMPQGSSAAMILVDKKAITIVMRESQATQQRNIQLQAGIDQAAIDNDKLMRIARAAKDFVDGLITIEALAEALQEVNFAERAEEAAPALRIAQIADIEAGGL